jgi:splicing factor U2AF subunit
LYQHPTRQAELLQASGVSSVATESQTKEDFLALFEDLYMELATFGRIEALHIVDNLGDHMIGHVYCKFEDEEEASDALQGIQGRYYDGRPVVAEFSPVTDFAEARCRDYDEDQCARGYVALF